MNLRCRPAVLLTLVVVGTWPLLAGTKIVHRWVLTGLPMPQFQRILVAGVMENYLVRQDFEDEMKTQLAKYGVDGVSSIDFLPPKSEMMEGEAKQRIKESTLDGVLVVRPKEARRETEEVVTGECTCRRRDTTPFGPIGTWPTATLFRRVHTPRKT